MRLDGTSRIGETVTRLNFSGPVTQEHPGIFGSREMAFGNADLYILVCHLLHVLETLAVPEQPP